MKFNNKRTLILDILIVFFIIGIGLASYTYKQKPFPFPITPGNTVSTNIETKPKVEKINIGRNHYWIILPPSFNSETSYPVLIYMHGKKYDPPHVDRAKLHINRNWLPNLKNQKFIIALPTLPLRSYPTWTTRDNGFIKNVISDVLNRYNQHSSPLYLSGFSAGALHSLYMGLNHVVNVDGIIAIAYGLTQRPNTIKASAKTIPVFLAVGRNDYYSRGVVRYTYRALKKLKFKDLIIKEYPIGHWVHKNNIKDIQKWIEKRTSNSIALGLPQGN